MSDRDVVHKYLISLSKYLSRLDKSDANEVIREIESHIYDAMDEAGGQRRIEDVLAGFGSPRELASSYVRHMLEGAPPPPGFKAIQSIKKGVSRSLYYSTLTFGYGWSAILALLALYKMIRSENVGVWGAENGQALVVSVGSHPPEASSDVLGWWLVPIALILALVSGVLTRRLQGVLSEKR